MSSVRHPTVLVLLAVLGFSAAACDVNRVQGPRTWTAGTQSVSGKTFVVNVRDTSGRIEDVEIDPQAVQGLGGPANPPGQPDVLIVPWTGGTCDEQTDIEVAANGSGLSISITTATAAGDCDAMGVAHAIRLTGSAAVPVASVTVTMP